MRTATAAPAPTRDTRRIRLRAVWLLVLPFLWLARPTPALLAAGGSLALAGLALRGWAAGVIRKEKELSTAGPYAHTRNPLYLGSFLLGLGVVAAGGRWVFLPLFLGFFVAVYGRTMKQEEELLESLFGDAYREYAHRVPLFLPRPTAWAPETASPDAPSPAQGGFSLSRYRRNREYEAALGVAAGFAFLAAKMLWI